MAKEKKSTGGAKKKSGGGDSKKKQPQSPVAAQADPRIDTSLAAENAAAMIANRAGSVGNATAPSSALPRQESAQFKKMKQDLNKPTLGSIGGVLNAPGSQKKSNLPFGGPKQLGRNQTFGADVNRTGVPRRTGGG